MFDNNRVFGISKPLPNIYLTILKDFALYFQRLGSLFPYLIKPGCLFGYRNPV
jgi:hypothetical protein